MHELRFGLVGTGPWASTVHGPALVDADGVDLVGVWGRSSDKAAALARSLDVTSFDHVDDMLTQVDAVAFAVPPDVQVRLALEAARAGKHLLLEKPVATDAEAARELAEEAARQSAASVVFFTDRFSDEGATWLAEVSARGDWLGGGVLTLASLDSPDNPFRDSAWRRERGALWDIGPHALSTLIGALGPVVDLVAVGGRGDLVHLVLTHQGGATSTASLSLFAPEAAQARDAWVWGESGTVRLPAGSREARTAFARAATALRDSARSGQPHPADLRLGVRVVELLEDAERQLR